MSNISPQRISIVVVQFRHVLKICRALSHQSALAKKRHFGLWVETVLSSEVVHVCHKLISWDADKRILNFAGDVLGHGDDALLAPAFMVRIAASIVGAEAIVLHELRLFRDLGHVVAGHLSAVALLLLKTRGVNTLHRSSPWSHDSQTDLRAYVDEVQPTHSGACQIREVKSFAHNDRAGMVFLKGEIAQRSVS